MAANYMLNQWDGLEAIPTGGDYSWDNNLIERINRYVSLPRRNSLFFGSHAGAKRGCIFYSLACSCRLHRINFFEYLRIYSTGRRCYSVLPHYKLTGIYFQTDGKRTSRASDPAFLFARRNCGDAYPKTANNATKATLCQPACQPKCQPR